MLCKRGLCRHAVSVRPSVRPSVTFVGCVKTNKHIFKLFSLSGSHTILVFLYQTAWQYSDGNACGVLSQYLTSSHAVNATTASCYQRDCRPIPGYQSMPAGELVLSTDGGPSSGVSQTVTVQVCLRHRKPRTSEYSEEKRT